MNIHLRLRAAIAGSLLLLLTIGTISEYCLRQSTPEAGSLEQSREILTILHWAQPPNHSSSAAATWILIGTLLSVFLIVFFGLWIHRDVTRRQEAEAALSRMEEGLEARVRERTADLSKTVTFLEAELVEQQKTGEQLRESELRYGLLFETGSLGKVICDAETLALLAANSAAQQLFGYSREEFLQMTMAGILHPEEVAAMMDFLTATQTTGFSSSTFVAQHKSGKLITIEARAQSIEFHGRRAQLWQVIDVVTEHKRLELQLRQSQKMESIGNLAGGIAHDFNNLLTVILGHSQKALSDLDGGNPLREKVAEIQAAGQRAASLTSQLLAFSRKQVLKPQILEINSVVSNISEMLGRLLGEDIQMSLHLDPKAGHVEADPTQLEQVLVNLAVNARDAMPNGGELVIESRSLRLDRHAAALNGLEPGPYVLLAVRDTGCGMDEQTQARIFEPFFTTKEVGKGTGLGLSTVLGVVQQSGGTVTVYSETGVGTTFKIYLPLVDAPDARIAESDECNLAAAPAGGTILLVEDEPSLRALAREVLREAGYVVFEAKNGREALQLANDLACPPDLLLTDVVMPEMSGVAVAAELQKKWPGLTVLCTSGYTDHALLERGALPQDIRFLQKPYMPESLLEQVAAVLRSRKRQANEESAESLLVSSI